LIKYPSSIKTISERETAILAADFIATCKTGDRVVLNGNLGAGKTFFIKSALSSLGITEVKSPSFAIVNEYYKDFNIYHFDFYRLKNLSELFDIGWQDYINDEESLIFIEWGNRLPSILPSERVEVNVEMMDGTEREFRFEKLG
jgi:tRNA threonylcarbamoyladenosine biosynthesis protein TsaE